MPCLNEYDIVAEPKTDKSFEAKNVHIYVPMSYDHTKDGKWSDDEEEPNPTPETNPTPEPGTPSNPRPGTVTDTRTYPGTIPGGRPTSGGFITMPSPSYPHTTDGQTTSSGSTTTGERGDATPTTPTQTTTPTPVTPDTPTSEVTTPAAVPGSDATVLSDNINNIDWQTGAANNGTAAGNVELRIPRTGDDTMSVVPILIVGAIVVAAGASFKLTRRNKG